MELLYKTVIVFVFLSGNFCINSKKFETTYSCQWSNITRNWFDQASTDSELFTFEIIEKNWIEGCPII